MIVDYLDVVSFAVLPLEADPVSVIDSNTVLPLPVTLEGLQPKPRQIEVSERCHGVKHFQPDTGGLLYRLEAPAEFPFQQPPNIFIPAGTDHTFLILRYSYYSGKGPIRERFSVAARRGTQSFHGSYASDRRT
jgi:hypothetical protein